MKEEAIFKGNTRRKGKGHIFLKTLGPILRGGLEATESHFYVAVGLFSLFRKSFVS